MRGKRGSNLFIIVILILLLVMSLLISLVVLGLVLGLITKSSPDEEKLDPFECGFSPQSKPRNPFSMHFFLTSIIFLIFDVELVLLFPAMAGVSAPTTSWLIFSVVVILLLLGVILEWSQKMLE